MGEGDGAATEVLTDSDEIVSFSIKKLGLSNKIIPMPKAIVPKNKKVERGFMTYFLSWLVFEEGSRKPMCMKENGSSQRIFSPFLIF